MTSHSYEEKKNNCNCCIASKYVRIVTSVWPFSQRYYSIFVIWLFCYYLSFIFCFNCTKMNKTGNYKIIVLPKWKVIFCVSICVCCEFCYFALFFFIISSKQFSNIFCDTWPNDSGKLKWISIEKGCSFSVNNFWLLIEIKSWFSFEAC